MASSGFLALMYHEIGVADRPPRDSSPGYLRYVVSRQDFQRQLTLLRDEGIRGASLTDMLHPVSPAEPALAITFDDGCETDLLEAAPLLAALGFGATFFIVPEFLNQRGYLSTGGLRELVAQKFEIGSHGMSHRFLTQLPAPELDAELSQSKQVLEEICGTEVTHLSCPGGRCNRTVSSRALSLGYRSVSTSRIGRNDPVADRACLARLAIRRGTGLATFRRRCRGEGLARERWRAALLSAARRALGDAAYDALQRRLG